MKKILFLAVIQCAATMVMAQQAKPKDGPVGMEKHRQAVPSASFYSSSDWPSRQYAKDSLNRRQTSNTTRSVTGARFTVASRDSIHTPAIYKNEQYLIKLNHK